MDSGQPAAASWARSADSLSWKKSLGRRSMKPSWPGLRSVMSSHSVTPRLNTSWRAAEGGRRERPWRASARAKARAHRALVVGLAPDDLRRHVRVGAADGHRTRRVRQPGEAQVAELARAVAHHLCAAERGERARGAPGGRLTSALSGFTSRCTMPCECRYASASAQARAMPATRSKGKRAPLLWVVLMSRRTSAARGLVGRGARRRSGALQRTPLLQQLGQQHDVMLAARNCAAPEKAHDVLVVAVAGAGRPLRRACRA